jgi:hypothetical protein
MANKKCHKNLIFQNEQAIIKKHEDLGSKLSQKDRRRNNENLIV